jgi:hypothetical protein
MLRNQFGLEADDGIAIGDNGLSIVLRFVACASGLSGNDEGAFS